MDLSETVPLGRPAEAPEATLARLRRLLDVSVALNTFGDTARLLDYIAQTTTDVLDCEVASILLFDEVTGALRFEAATGQAGAQLVGTEVPLLGSLAGTAFRENRVLHATNATADARRHRETDEQTGFATRVLVAVPMRIDGRPVGVLEALNPHRDAFDQSDAQALLIVAEQAAVAIRSARHEAALRRAHDRLAELDRLKTDFMAIASHELRTPVTTVQGYGQILTEELRGDLRSFAESIAQASNRMMEVIETIDVMAELQDDQGVRPDAPTSLAKVLRDVVAEWAPHAEVVLPPGPLLVEGDARRLRLAFGNLLRNAVRFSSPDGPVRVRAEVAYGEVRVAVADEGRGLASADLERIFEAYVQVADPDHRDHDGLGIGLTVARAVLLQHGGRLWAESEGLGRGATFYARLSLATAP